VYDADFTWDCEPGFAGAEMRAAECPEGDDVMSGVARTFVVRVAVAALAVAGLAVAQGGHVASGAPHGGIIAARPHYDPTRLVANVSTGISFHGGPLIINPIVYPIFYGNWTSQQQSLISTYLHNLGPSGHYGIVTAYTNSSGTHISHTLNVGAPLTITGFPVGSYNGTTNSMGDAGIAQIVQLAFSRGMPQVGNGLYLVLTSPEVTDTSGYLTAYCGWHTHGTINNQNTRYAFIGDPMRGLAACAAQSNGPNGDPGVDAMISIIDHEVFEAVTDPDLNAWYDSRGAEVGDKCAWTFGSQSTSSNGAQYNIVFGGLQFLIQQEWVRASAGYCAQGVSSTGTQGYTISTSPNAGTISPGQASTFEVTNNPAPGSSAQVTLSLQDVPDGLSFSFDPPVIGPGESSTLTIIDNGGILTSLRPRTALAADTGLGADPGTYPITVVGTSDTGEVETTRLLSTVQPDGSDDFAISANTAALTLAADQSATVHLTTAVTQGVSQPVTLTAEGPDGAQLNFAGLGATPYGTHLDAGDSADLIIDAGSAVPGNYVVHVRADGSEGQADHSVDIALDVTKGHLAAVGAPVSILRSNLAGTVTFKATVASVEGRSAPSVSVPVTFTVSTVTGAHVSCTAFTGEDGVATCKSKPALALLVAGRTYRITIPETANYFGVSTTGRITL
jgi:hypothetical protein